MVYYLCYEYGGATQKLGVNRAVELSFSHKTPFLKQITVKPPTKKIKNRDFSGNIFKIKFEIFCEKAILES